MVIGSRHNINNLVDKPCISVYGKLLNRVTVTESLGIHIDQFLSWDFYIEKLTKKNSGGIVAISRLKPFVCRNTLISVYNALVQTYFDYCCEVWDPIGSILSNKLQTLQNRAARIIMGYPNEHGCSEAALTALGWKHLRNVDLNLKPDSCIRLFMVLHLLRLLKYFLVLQLSDLMTTIYVILT